MDGNSLKCVNNLGCTDEEIYNDAWEKIGNKYSGTLNGKELSPEDVKFWYDQLVVREGIEEYDEFVPFDLMLSMLVG